MREGYTSKTSAFFLGYCRMTAQPAVSIASENVRF
jgi:hypothetical protein